MAIRDRSTADRPRRYRRRPPPTAAVAAFEKICSHARAYDALDRDGDRGSWFRREVQLLQDLAAAPAEDMGDALVKLVALRSRLSEHYATEAWPGPWPGPAADMALLSSVIKDLVWISGAPPELATWFESLAPSIPRNQKTEPRNGG